MAYKVGVVGLGVMGGNLARNIESKGFPVAGYDTDTAKTKAFLAGPAQGRDILSLDSLAGLLAVLERPRRILMMVPAGAAVDSAIALVRPHLQAGDILIDGGNSNFLDTDRRCRELETAGFHFVGMGVSGGEEGALKGPALMPGGADEAWQELAPVLRAIAARADDGEPCVAHMGPRGAGHYVKMVHNGIESGDMQLIAEVYDLLHRGAGVPASELAALFEEWNRGELQSYLIDITAQILERVDADTGRPVIDVILDEAQPIPAINAAVDARVISALKPERMAAGRLLAGPSGKFTGDRARLIEAARQALYASKVTSYAQGLSLLRSASREYGYDIDPGLVAKVWRAGCIIRASLLGDIRAAYGRDAGLVNLLLDDAFREAVSLRQEAWRFFVQTAIGLGIPVAATSASLAYYDAYRSARLPANLTQAQRDFFGAHTYRRVDREGTFHTDWSAPTLN